MTDENIARASKQQLRACPFCAAVHTVRFARSSEEDTFDASNDDYWHICCDYTKGGCGAEGGHRSSPEEAEALWNGRPFAVETADKQWRCFHCDEVLTDREAAADHFGTTPDAVPGCMLKVGEDRGILRALRAAEAELARYRAEDSDTDRAMYKMQAEHAVALRREEEKGYARALRDTRYTDNQRVTATPLTVTGKSLHDEECENCGEPWSKHLTNKLICPDAGTYDVYFSNSAVS